MRITVEPQLLENFPGLQVLVRRIDGLTVGERSEELQQFKAKVVEEIKRRYDIATVKDEPIFRAYRDFFWRAGIDPTKVRPAAEALIRRVLAGKPIPTINTLVDSYNLASINTGIALGAFDAEKLTGDLILRLAQEGENFLGIGMSGLITLQGNELVVADGEKLIAVYPYRDADNTKVTTATKNLCLLVCGAPRIDEETLNKTSRMAIDYIVKFCGGKEVE